MAKATKVKKLKKHLSKEVNLPIPVPENKVGGFLGKTRKLQAPKYFRESWREVKKVVWPSRKDSWKFTFAVVIFTAIFTIIIAIADFGFSELVERC